jgi:hypothetical protein
MYEITFPHPSTESVSKFLPQQVSTVAFEGSMDRCCVKLFISSCIFGACNEITRLPRPIQSRFRRLHLPPYTEEQFLEVSAKVLPKLKIAHVIGKAVWRQRADIRDVISIGKLVRKNDGPEEVEQILSTMTKYGEMKGY